MSTATDDPDAIAADLPEHDDALPLALVGSSFDEAQDAEDAALLAAATHLHGASVRIGPTYLSARDLMPTTGRWIDRAECGEAPPTDRDVFTESRTQAEAKPVTDAYCSGCPVALQCLDEGRATRGWGVFGGLVLVDGKKAPQNRPSNTEAKQLAPGVTATDWLAGFLTQHGPSQRREILTAATEAGHSRHRMDHAGNALNVVRHRVGQGVEWSLPEVEQATEEATQGAALWLIDHLAAHGPTARADVLTAAPHSRAATMAGATLLDLDAEADVWELS